MYRVICGQNPAAFGGLWCAPQLSYADHVLELQREYRYRQTHPNPTDCVNTTPPTTQLWYGLTSTPLSSSFPNSASLGTVHMASVTCEASQAPDIPLYIISKTTHYLQSVLYENYAESVDHVKSSGCKKGWWIFSSNRTWLQFHLVLRRLLSDYQAPSN
jgi:hypothetical protein